MSSIEPAVIIEKTGYVATLRLNRPDNRNSMTPELLDTFADAVQELRRDHAVRCVVVTGTGSCFSSGADFRAIVQRGDQARSSGERSYAMYAPFLSLTDLEVPVIGALQGHAVGGGFGLSLCCDLRIANNSARYGANFAKLGISAGLAISDVLPRLIGVPRAMELLMTGQLISGEQGAAWGLFNYSVEGDQVLERALQLADEIARSAPIAVRLMKRSIYQNLGWDPRTAAWREAFVQAATLPTDDAREGIDALLAKRPPHFHGR
jgi:enoyl-CoA hydratase/carnithine racemase